MKTIKQVQTFNAPPAELYEWFMNSKKHSQFTGAVAKIGQKVGAKFSAWNGYIAGTNTKLIPGKLIEQSWRGGDWAKGAYSKATFKFSAAGKGKTKLHFSQTGVPDQNYKSIKQGWADYYWQPLKATLKKLEK